MSNETDGHRPMTFSLPADVCTILEELLAKVDPRRREVALQNLERELLLAILRFHRAEGLVHLGADQGAVKRASLGLVP